VPDSPGGAIVRLFLASSPGSMISYSFLDSFKNLLYQSELKTFAGEIYIS